MLTHAKKSPAGAVVFFVIVFVIIIAMARRLAGNLLHDNCVGVPVCAVNRFAPDPDGG